MSFNFRLNFFLLIKSTKFFWVLFFHRYFFCDKFSISNLSELKADEPGSLNLPPLLYFHDASYKNISVSFNILSENEKFQLVGTITSN